MFFVSLKTRYDINLVAVRQHIECASTYRVIYDILKISQEIYIDEKKGKFKNSAERMKRSIVRFSDAQYLARWRTRVRREVR